MKQQKTISNKKMFLLSSSIWYININKIFKFQINNKLTKINWPMNLYILCINIKLNLYTISFFIATKKLIFWKPNYYIVTIYIESISFHYLKWNKILIYITKRKTKTSAFGSLHEWMKWIIILLIIITLGRISIDGLLFVY